MARGSLIRFFRGIRSNLQALSSGEPAWLTDELKLLVGRGSGLTPVEIGASAALFTTVSPTALSADQNNYSAGGTSTTASLFLRLTTDGSANRTVTGISVGQTGGQLLVVRNVDGAKTIILTNADAASDNANRFDMGNPATDATLFTNQNATFIYDGTSLHWIKI